MTNVIQELLKRAHAEGMLKGVQQNWSQWKGADMQASEDAIQKMVKSMAWTRNNIRAANVTDANDAKMASMSAREVKDTLKKALSGQLSEKSLTAQMGTVPEEVEYNAVQRSYKLSDGSIIDEENIFE